MLVAHAGDSIKTEIARKGVRGRDGMAIRGNRAAFCPHLACKRLFGCSMFWHMLVNNIKTEISMVFDLKLYCAE